MITLLDGTKLPSHSELYTIWPHIEQRVFTILFDKTAHDITCKTILSTFHIDQSAEPSLRKALELSNFFRSMAWRCHSQFEIEGWDVVLYEGDVLDLRRNDQRHYYNIEYKSNVTEWNKSIHEFLAQINNRQKTDSRGRQNCYGTVLLTFDHRFLQYQQLLATNNVRLLLLPQIFLSKDEQSLSHAASSRVLE